MVHDGVICVRLEVVYEIKIGSWARVGDGGDARPSRGNTVCRRGRAKRENGFRFSNTDLGARNRRVFSSDDIVTIAIIIFHHDT